MTLQTSPEPGPYSTAPPWANQAAPAPAAPPTAPPGGQAPHDGFEYYQHGQLLVRFPEEVLAGGRPDAPSWKPVVVWTFFLSVLGVVSAMRRAGRARHYGRPRLRYWMAFGLTLVVGGVFWTALTLKVAIPLYLKNQEAAITAVVEGGLLTDNRIKTEIGAVTSASCQPQGYREADGMLSYLCTFKLEKGTTTSAYLMTDERGNWEFDTE
ncbi:MULTISPECIES: hypothetical protein [Actinoplanes]|uniref:hypothetical protein n=1 Tax=Actinoplanes TaxID=1865 RepID=UPI0005F2F2A3|nr:MULTISPECIES: hypothetical protein [Actinoplanes]GLY01642.1 hypothetical protein Acsp01_20210 [Actinoplanes sp. NBRC 101535]